MHHQLHYNTTFAAYRLRLRLALALLLPLWTRSATQHEVLVVLLIVIFLTALAHQTRHAAKVDLVKDLVAAFGGTFVAKCVAGSWMRLGMTYLLSRDALYYLFPDVEHVVRLPYANL
jgi:hypothetical protein